ncbi:MAG TPA: recombination regulator RecX [Bacillales bacterium]|nr:recombination regulator RecX [Bacillales bacterium]
MAVITRITVQKKNKSRFNIFLDRGHGEEFGFGVSEDVLVAFAISKGQEIDEAELKDIVFEDEIKVAFNLALNSLSYRMRSVKEIKDYLRKKETASEVIEKVLERLEHHQYVDDREFAKSFVRSRKRTSTKGPGAIYQELRQKGVAEGEIVSALEEYPQEEQMETAAKFAAKQARQHRKKSNTDMKRSIAQSLAGKGFDREVIDLALNEGELEKGDDEEWEALVLQAEKAHRRYNKYEGWEYEQRMKQYLYRKGFPFLMIDQYLAGREP